MSIKTKYKIYHLANPKKIKNNLKTNQSRSDTSDLSSAFCFLFSVFCIQLQNNQLTPNLSRNVAAKGVQCQSECRLHSSASFDIKS